METGFNSLSVEQRRDKILELLSRGELTPDKAEATARDAGCRPLQSRPKPDEHNPEGKDRWTLPMVLTWIATRDIDAVRDQDNDFRSECFELFFQEYKVPTPEQSWEYRRGYLLKHPSRATRAQLMFDEKNAQHIRSAETVLRRELITAKLNAEAVRDSDGSVVVIPAIEWPRLQFCEHRDCDYLCFENDSLGRAYSQLLFRRSELMEIWPRTPSGVVSSGKAAADCTAWLQNLVKEAPERRPKSKGALYHDALEKFPGLSRKSFDQAWHQCAPLGWQAGGRPKGSKTPSL
jgi:hypothetical protein